jgi:hypothetical protein
MQEGIKSIGEFVVSRGEATDLFETIKESLDDISCLVRMPVDPSRPIPVAARRDDGLSANRLDGLDQGVAVVALVGDDRLGRNGFDQGSTLGDIGHLAGGQDQSDGIAQRIYAGVNLGGQSAPRAADRLIATVFWRAGRVLVGTNDCGIDEQFFQISIPLEPLGDAMPDTIRFPTGEADTCRVPAAQFFRQVTPGTARARHVQHGFDEPPVVCRLSGGRPPLSVGLASSKSAIRNHWLSLKICRSMINIQNSGYKGCDSN